MNKLINIFRFILAFNARPTYPLVAAKALFTTTMLLLLWALSAKDTAVVYMRF